MSARASRRPRHLIALAIVSMLLGLAFGPRVVDRLFGSRDAGADRARVVSAGT